MGVRQRPTRTTTTAATTAASSSSPSSTTALFDIQPSSSSSSPAQLQQHQDQEEHSPLSTINLENDCNTANQPQHIYNNRNQPRRSSSSSFSKSDSWDLVVMPVQQATTRSTGTSTNNNNVPFPRFKRTNGILQVTPLPRTTQQRLRFPSVSLLALFIMMASGCFFFNMIMVLVPPVQHILSATVSDRDSTTMEMELQQRRRRSEFSLLPSNNASYKLRRKNNNTNMNNRPVQDYYHARVVYSINNNNKNNGDTMDDYEWSVVTPPPHDDHPPSTRRVVDDEFMRVTESIQPIPSNDANDGHVENEEDCIPMANWQTASYPSCNSFHEIDLPSAINAAGGGNDDDTKRIIHKNDTSSSNATRVTVRSSALSLSEDVFRALGEGWFRTTWQWNRRDVASTLLASNETPTSTTQRPHQREEEESVVIKTLRIEREFLWEYYDLHNRDAVAMERLTFSPYVVNVYGYCGQSAINELADFPVPDMNILEKMNRRLRGFNDHRTSILKLHVAARIATGLAHVHAAGQVSSSPLTPPRPSMVHYDLNPKNVAIFRGGRPKIVRDIVSLFHVFEKIRPQNHLIHFAFLCDIQNDFNIAEFLRYNPKTNQTCGFKSRMHGPWWRAPEEMYLNETVYLDETVDVYSLGQTLFHLLTSKAPRGQMLASREVEARELVKTGKRPGLMQPFSTSNDTVFVAFRNVFDLCHEPDPRKRGTAQQVADILWQAMDQERETLRSKAAGAQQSSLDASAPPPLALALSAANNGNEDENDDEPDLDTKQ
jgi:serine/threonine protein kinase